MTIRDRVGQGAMIESSKRDRVRVRTNTTPTRVIRTNTTPTRKAADYAMMLMVNDDADCARAMQVRACVCMCRWAFA